MTTRDRYRCTTHIRDLLTEHTHPDLQAAHQDLDDCLPHFTDAIHRLMDARRSPLAGTAYDKPTTTGTGGDVQLTQTERLAASPDRAQAVIDRLDSALRRLEDRTRSPISCEIHHASIARDARAVWKIVEAWRPHAPTDRDRRAIERANLDRDKGCEHHARQNIYEPVHRTSNVGGNLEHPMALCRPCYDQVLRKGRLPDADWIERLRRTGKDEGERILPGR